MVDAFKGGLKNIPKYMRLFGGNFILIDNDRDLPPKEWEREVGQRVHKIARRIISAPVSNPVGQRWLRDKSSDEAMDELVAMGQELGLYET